MRVIPIEEIIQMDDGEQVRACSGTLIKLYDYKSGSNSQGDWSIQRGVLKDRGGKSITVMFKDRDELAKQWRGKELMLESHNGDRGLSGLYAFDDEYNDKTTRVLKVTPTAEVYLAGDEDGRETPAPREQSRRAPDKESSQTAKGSQGKGQGSAQSSGSAPEPSEDREAKQARAVLDAKKQASKLANGFCIAIDVVQAVIAPHYESSIGEMTNEQHQAAIGHIFGCLQRDGYIDGLPIRPLDIEARKPEPQPQPHPQRPAEPRPQFAKPTPPDDDIPF